MSIFETLRDEVSISEVLGVEEGRKISCISPEHTHDASPSMHNYGDHVYCFGCGFHADVVSVHAAIGGYDSQFEAALDLARSRGVKLPERDPVAERKARERRDKERRHEEAARHYHEALEAYPRKVEWWEDRGFGAESRERFLLGYDREADAATIPYWSRGRVQAITRRKLSGPPKYLHPKAEEFPRGHKPLFIPGRVKVGALLVEGIVDALAGAALGESTIALVAARISEKQRTEFEKVSGPLYIVPDDDPEGEKGAREWLRQLYPKALLCPPEYGEGNKDLADLFAAVDPEEARKLLEVLKSRAGDALALELSEAPDERNSLGAYRAAKERVLPLLLKLEDDGEQDAALHDVARKLKLSIKPLRKALSKMVASRTKPEPEEQQEKAEEAALPESGTERYERAMKLLKDRRLLDRAAIDMKKLGHVGELAAKKLALICAVSARSGRPIQPSTHAQSSAGKNFLWDTALSLVPPEMVVKRSGLSAKALFRTQTNLKGAVLYVQEVAGSEGAEYTIRVMQSDGRLEYEATEKMPDGSMKNVVHQTEGPTVVVQTTTRNHLHPENETRVFPIYIDESERQTGRIVGSILREASGEGPDEAEKRRIRQRWHDAIRLLEAGDVRIGYADRIEIPNSPLRIRRDARRLLDVVRAIAWLYQHQRERDLQGRILASEEDFNEALRLVSESLRRAWQTLTPSEESVLRSIRELPEQPRTKGFKRRDLKVREVSDRRVKEVLKSLTDTGYLDCDGRQGPQGYTYTLARDAEKISLGISLRPLPDKDESPIDKPNTNGRDASARYRPTPESEADENGHREAGATGRNGHRPIKTADLQEEHATGRTGGDDEMCKHGLRGGKGCYLCDPQHPYRLKTEATT